MAVTAAQIQQVREIVRRESGLAVVTTLRADGSMQASVVNAGVVDHPVSGDHVVGFAVRGPRRKLQNLRNDGRATIVFRAAWDWVAVEGQAQITGPHDTIPGLDPRAVLRLLRTIYAAAVGGSADDWAHLDQQMIEEAHSAVLVRPMRVYSNPAEGSH